MIICMLIQPGGSATRHQVSPQSIVREAQMLIGGYVEPLAIRRDGKLYTLLLDEDGNPKRLPKNPSASVLAGRTIVGPALLFTGALNDLEGVEG